MNWWKLQCSRNNKLVFREPIDARTREHFQKFTCKRGECATATFPLSCADARPRSSRRIPAQYFRSAAHCISIDNRTTNYVLSIFRADLFLELTRPSIPRALSKLLEGTLVVRVSYADPFINVAYSRTLRGFSMSKKSSVVRNYRG